MPNSAISTLNNKRYNATSIDNASLWYSTMGHPSSGVFKKLKFIDDMLIQFYDYEFDKVIKTIRSDNGIEFTNQDLTSYLLSLGIMLQTSCARTPQPNGRAEIKHQHLLNFIGLPSTHAVTISLPSGSGIKTEIKALEDNHTWTLVPTPSDHRVVDYLAYYVHILSQHLASPRNDHLTGYKVLRYIKQLQGQGLFIAAKSPLNLIAYCDSDWGGCQATRQSLTTYCIMAGNSLVA
ncbi:hypothetical protein AgCh_017885 [Apium graveolens]